LTIALFGFAFFLMQCKKDDPPTVHPPKVHTGDYRATTNSMVGEILEVGPGISDYGHLWHDQISEPKLDDENVLYKSKGTTNEPRGIITAFDSTFDLSQTYYIRAYVVDIYDNKFYGNVIEFDIENVPTACFTFTLQQDLCSTNCEVQFENCTVGADAYLWDFGDGSVSNTENPAYSYAVSGNYVVELTAIFGNYNHDTTMAVFITDANDIVEADFTVINDFCIAPCEVNFVNNSSNATSYSWDFGDNNTSTEQHPSHTYENPGDYIVELVASSIVGSDTITKPVKIIEESMIIPEACFEVIGGDTICTAPCFREFWANCSVDANQYRWYIDSIIDVPSINSTSASRLFTEPGIHQVRLEVVSVDGIPHDTIQNIYVDAPDLIQPEACFVIEGGEPICEGSCTRGFSAICSTDADQYRWYFNGNLDAEYINESFAAKVFEEVGEHEVKLEVISVDGIVDDTIQTIQVNEVDAEDSFACFVIEGDSICEGSCTRNFLANCSTNADQYRWYFNGNLEIDYINQPYAAGLFDEVGEHEVKLEVISVDGIVDDTIQTIQVNELDVEVPFACFSTSTTTCVVDNNCLIYFDASCSSTDAVEYKWDFDGDGVFTNTGVISNNVYTQQGTFEATLRVINAAGGVKDTTQTITVYDIDVGFVVPTGTLLEGCPITFTNTTQNADSLLWDFGDGQTSTDEHPTHLYFNSGIYNVTLTAYIAGLEAQTSNIVEVSPVDKFERYIDKGSNNGLNDIIPAVDGNGYIVVGYIQGETGINAYIAKIDEFGEIIWENTFEGSGETLANAVCADSDGYVLTGFDIGSVSGSGKNIYVAKTDFNGNFVWDNRFGGTGYDEGFDIKPISDGEFIVAGTSSSFNDMSGGEGRDIYLAKVVLEGFVDWYTPVGGPGSDEGKSVVITDDGNYIVAGVRDGVGTGDDVRLVKFNNSGEVMTTRTFDNGGNEGAHAIIKNSDNGYVIVGYADGRSHFIKINSFSGYATSRIYDTVNSFESNDVVQTTDGGYALIGRGIFNSRDAVLIKTDVNGNFEWQVPHGGGDDDSGKAITLTDNCGYIFAGFYDDGGNNGNELLVHP